jgi:hypothetical protein
MNETPEIFRHKNPAGTRPPKNKSFPIELTEKSKEILALMKANDGRSFDALAEMIAEKFGITVTGVQLNHFYTKTLFGF